MSNANEVEEPVRGRGVKEGEERGRGGGGERKEGADGWEVRGEWRGKGMGR